MPRTRATQEVRHVFDGGWATDFGPSSTVGVENGVVRLPWLNRADNCIFELDGGPRKAPGTARINSSALESGATIRGAFDYWRTGTSGTPAQHRIVHIGTKIKKDDADGSFSDIFTGMQQNAVPDYSIFDDFLIISSDLDTPRSWDGSTAQTLAGSPPDFAFSEVHKGHLFAAGVDANPSTLYFCVPFDPEDWSSSGSGSIQIDPDDGDRITGIKSHRGELLVFKGPYKGSIHRITGSAATGTDAFAVVPHVTGIGATWNNTIFRFRSDLGFMWSDGTIHSLNATSAYGDYNQSSLTFPINTYLTRRVNRSELRRANAINWSERSMVLVSLPIDSATTPNTIIMIDYRFDPVRIAPWPGFDGYCASLALSVDDSDNSRHVPLGGGEDGFLRKFGQEQRSIDGITGISYDIETPYLDYGAPFMLKTFERGALGLAPKNDGDLTFGWTRDDNSTQTQTVSQGGTDVLAPTSGSAFTLGTSALGGSQFVNRFFDATEGGQFRSISYSLANSVNKEDVEIHSLSNVLHVDTQSSENI